MDYGRGSGTVSQWMLKLTALILCGIFNVTCLHYFIMNPFYYHLRFDTWESSDFRQMRISSEMWKELKKFSEKNELPVWETVTVAMVNRGFDLSEKEEISIAEYRVLKNAMEKIRYSEFAKLQSIYKDIFSCIRCFPVMISSTQPFRVNYEDSWFQPRSYGGDRQHEGCDLFCSNQNAETDTIPIVSMSDGTVEAMGWLELGGYRVGIRSDTGVYFYYAHLASFAEGIEVGQQISAGEIIGYMGDTGYSKVEGTTGNFPMHLHIGIYIQTDHYSELSVDPYSCLKYIEEEGTLYGRFPLQK